MAYVSDAFPLDRLDPGYRSKSGHKCLPLLRAVLAAQKQLSEVGAQVLLNVLINN